MPHKPDIYLKDRHDGEEILCAIRISTLGTDLDVPVTFFPESADRFFQDWNEWLDSRWTPFVAEHLLDVCLMARAMEAREVLACDAKMSSFLEPDEAERSFAAGRAVLEGASEARHHRVFDKLRDRLAGNEASGAIEVPGGETRAGHAATVFAVHAAAYHVALFPALVSYLYFEWRCGGAPLRDRRFELGEKQFVTDVMPALGGIRELLRKRLGDFSPAACA